MLKTERLRILPLKVEQFRMLLDDPDGLAGQLGLAGRGELMDSGTRQAMEGLYREVEANPQNWPWNTNWQIIEETQNIPVGSACFLRDYANPVRVGVGYGIDAAYRGRGYMTEALIAMRDWTFSHPGIETLYAETAEDNNSSQKILLRAGLKPAGRGEEGLLWELKKQELMEGEQENMKIISVRETPEYKEKAVNYISSAWPSLPRTIYENSISGAIYAASSLPQWYLLEKNGAIIGCAGLITNDFVSRMDLYPWVCALYIDELERGNSYGSLLLDRAREECTRLGFDNLYLTTGHRGLYEKYGYMYIGTGYHPWDEESHIYGLNIKVQELLRSGKYLVRPENPAEFEDIYDLIRAAFETARVKEGDEQDFAEKLRSSENYIPELALVVETTEGLAGHIMLTKTYIDTAAGEYEALLLAPVSVLAQHRDKGVGSMLIIESMRRARQMGYKAVFLCGDPAYYHRFGFRSVADLGMTYVSGIEAQYMMVCELNPGALKGVKGIVDYC